ncbi:unnamed protein product [Timema podura]|uniref:Uncharacterized protein n=1 Tax=Timema podura TaxID=61482 RepID=A0ABN7NV73_TIMPD|nr:unnamed protein product [Timema podura]
MKYSRAKEYQAWAVRVQRHIGARGVGEMYPEIVKRVHLLAAAKSHPVPSKHVGQTSGLCTEATFKKQPKIINGVPTSIERFPFMDKIVIFKIIMPEFTSRQSGKPFSNNHPQYTDRDSNLDLPISGSLVYCESRALDLYASEAGHQAIQTEI